MGFSLGNAVQGGAQGYASSGSWWGAAAGALAGGFGGGGGDGGAGSPKHMMNVMRRNADKNISMYETERDQLGSYYNPYMESGKFANTQIGNMLGQRGQEAADLAWNQTLSPGARFLEQQQNAALLRNKAALGDIGGNQLAALANQSNMFNFGQAQQYMNNLQNLQGVGLGATNAYQSGRSAYTNNIANMRTAKATGMVGALAGMNADQNASLANNIQLGGALGTQLGNLFSGITAQPKGTDYMATGDAYLPQGSQFDLPQGSQFDVYY